MRVNPYTALLERAKQFATAVKHPRRKLMWRYPSNRMKEAWTLGDLAERTRAADQLGYDVRLEWTDEGLNVFYVERVAIPFEFEY